MQILYALGIVGLSLLLSMNLPYFYIRAKESVISASKQLEFEKRDVKNSWVVALICLLPSLLVLIITKNNAVTAITLALGLIAYCDFAIRWIPDCLLYSTVWLSLVLRAGQMFDQGIMGAVLFCLPMLIVQGFSLMTKQKGCFASGDLYLTPALGVWFMPEIAPALMACVLLISSFVSRFIKEVPLITCILPVFTGYQICAKYLYF